MRFTFIFLARTPISTNWGRHRSSPFRFHTPTKPIVKVRTNIDSITSNNTFGRTYPMDGAPENQTMTVATIEAFKEETKQTIQEMQAPENHVLASR